MDRWKRESKTKRVRGNRKGGRKTLERNSHFQVLKTLQGKTFAVFPFFVFFSRVILPETSALAFTMLGIFFFYLNSDHKEKNLISIINYLLSAVFFALSLLIKPMLIFYLLPVIVLFYRKYKFNLIKKLDFYFYFVITLLPLICWRIYIKNFITISYKIIL